MAAWRPHLIDALTYLESPNFTLEGRNNDSKDNIPHIQA